LARVVATRIQSPQAATLTISFGGKADDIVSDVSVAIADGILRLEDPKGPNGTTVRYTAVRKGRELVGIAELAGNPQVYAVGSWRARPQ
jgi:hypothetical protein